MKQTVQLSVILTTHGDPGHFNALLSNLLGFDNGRFEVIIIHDGSDPVTTKFIESEIRKSSNERVYLYEHTQRAGRGISLNEGLLHAEGVFVWAPLRAERLNEALLIEAVQRFRSAPAAFWSLDYALPKHLPSWIKAADEGDLPDDSCLFWNRDVIGRESLFFNPYMETLHGAELAMRISQDYSWVQTDPFFVVAEDQSPIAQVADMKELVFSALRLTDDQGIRDELMRSFSTAEQYMQRRQEEDFSLLEARNLLASGDANRSLELVERFLKRNPENPEALRIKITSLEKLRRHVEATELKHRLYKKSRIEAEKVVSAPSEEKESSEEPESIPMEQVEEFNDSSRSVIEEELAEPEAASEVEEVKEVEQTSHLQPENPDKPQLSIVIPTAAHGKALLEQSLIHLETSVSTLSVELIVIDNASLDDTFEYLEQLTHKKFLNIKVIVNQVNRGVPAALNQGFEMANGQYLLFMHNDLLPEPETIPLLIETLAKSKDVAMAVPLLNQTDYKSQLVEREGDSLEAEVETADSCCFMVHGSLSLRFDEEFRPCFYEMDDFCRQIRSAGLKIMVQNKARANHLRGGSTRAMALHLDPEELWKNRARFRKKWYPERTAAIPDQGNHAERFRRLGAPLNPLEPDPDWLNTVRDYLTSEVRTGILRGEWSSEELFTIMLTLLIADERELLRTLEERLTTLKPDTELLKLFILYYHRKNIYSRCRHYIEMAEKEDPEFDLFELRMLISEKEYERAVPLLNELLALYPSSPELYSHAAEIYRQNQEHEEADSFNIMAHQLHPIKYRHHAGGFSLKL